MPTLVEPVQSALGRPRSPLSASTNSSRRSSLKKIYPERPLDDHNPTSPFTTRLTRKRAASLELETEHHPNTGDLALNSGSTNGPPTSGSAGDRVCLCQPDPKIPRPRNAFILYRQHYQAQVAAQNPGLANPEISKIIGEQWREQSLEVKSDWKRLAEEEKARHHRQYPGYRYQPRRAGKGNGIHPPLSFSPDGPTRCPKCNGRYISTPSTPQTPFHPVVSEPEQQPDHRLPPFTAVRFPEPAGSKHPLQMQPARVGSPRGTPSHQTMVRRPQFPPPQQPVHRPERDEDLDHRLSPSPDFKRRRYNEGQRFSFSSPTTYTAQNYSQTQGVPMSAGGYRQSLPGPGSMVRQGNMGPPPAHHPPHGTSPVNPPPRHQYLTRSNTNDERDHDRDSLRLPPLQTQIPPTPTSIHRPADPRAETKEIRAKSIEAMVMTIPVMSKIKVLTKICPPLAPPSNSSPAHEIRGAVIAIEGTNKALVAEVGSFINLTLGKDPSCDVKTWNITKLNKHHQTTPTPSRSSDMEMRDLSMTADLSSPLHHPTDEDNSSPFIEYLSIISEMHKKSLQIVKHITTKSASSSGNSTSSPIPNQSLTSSQTPVPVALLPTGFSLSTSDDFALRIPINDQYAPVDHWQWMATLWRGIVGPDLTVYVCQTSKEAVAKYGGVEVLAEAGAVFVRVAVTEVGEKPAMGERVERGMDEKTSRRLGFEILEFVRGGEGGFGRA